MTARDSTSTPLLEVSGLETVFEGEDGPVRAVDGVSFTIARGEILGMVGESGCGKSATALSLLRLLSPRGRIVGGSVRLDGEELGTASEDALLRVRGRRIAMIFQDPMTSLNPYLTVEDQLAEVAMLHLRLSRADAVTRAIALLERVGIPEARQRARGYPHQLSGGMRQRVMIAMALLCDPELLVADEPTTALDVTIQAQILDLLRDLSRERGLAVLLITHDLGVVAELADQVVVMYAGRVVESGPSHAVLDRPLHPYTRALLRSLPRLDAPSARLETIGGVPPRLSAGRFGACAFAPRCTLARQACLEGEPPLTPAGPGRARRCVLPEEEVG